MDQSVFYNLRNPAMVEDIGYSMINQMYPTTVGDMPAATSTLLPGTQINSGQPKKDSFESDKVKTERGIIGKILLLAGLFIGGKFLYKNGKNLLSKLGNIAQKIGTKIAKSAKNTTSKIIKKFKK